MLSLLVVFLFSGLCYGQDGFSDCATADTIVGSCATKHLEYLKEANEDQYIQMKNLDMISLPNVLLPMMDNICADKMHLMEYYQCSFSNMTTCLKDANSTQIMGVPDSSSIGNGIMALCDAKANLNQTCLVDVITNEVMGCFAQSVSGDNNKKPCEIFDGLMACAEEPLAKCEGGEDVKAFMVSARAMGCPYTGAAPLHLPSALLLLGGALIAHFF